MRDKGALPIDFSKDKHYIFEELALISNDAIRNRIANELCAYNKNANRYKLIYYILSILTISLPAASAALCTVFNSSWLIITLSVLTAICGSLLTALKPKELWIHYRSYAEVCKREISRHMILGVKNNDTNNIEHLLLERLEEIFEEENGKWQSIRKVPNSKPED